MGSVKYIHFQNKNFASEKDKLLFGWQDILQNIGRQLNLPLKKSGCSDITIATFIAFPIGTICSLAGAVSIISLLDSWTKARYQLDWFLIMGFILSMILIAFGISTIRNTTRQIEGKIPIYDEDYAWPYYNELVRNGVIIQGEIVEKRREKDVSIVEYRILYNKITIYGEYWSRMGINLRTGDIVNILYLSDKLHIPL